MVDKFSDRVNPIISYFLIYSDIIRLINYSDILLKNNNF